jgi:hypothetical protein
MSAPLIVSIPHRLGREEASRRLKAGLTRAAASIPVLQIEGERWEGDRLFFRVRALGGVDSRDSLLDANQIQGFFLGGGLGCEGAFGFERRSMGTDGAADYRSA